MKEYDDYDLQIARELFSLDVDKEILEQWVRIDDAQIFQKLTNKEIVQ